MALFLTVTLFPLNVFAEEEPVETTEETVTEAEETTEEVPEEVIAEEEEEPEEAVIAEETPAEEPEETVEEPETEVVPEEEPAEEPEEIAEEPVEEPEEIIPEEEPEEEIIPEEEPVEEAIPAEEPVEEIEEPEEETVPEEEPVVIEEEIEEKAEEETEEPEEVIPEEEPEVIEEETEEKAEAAEATEYKLIYNPNGGAFDATEYTLNADGNYESAAYSDGQVYVSYYTQPTRKNYKFAGWYKTAACTGDEQSGQYITITKNTTLYAKWTRVYTITYNANGGKMYDGNATMKREVDAGDTTWIMSGSDVERAGYAFDGWYTSKNYLASEKLEDYADYKPTKNITLYAKWAAAWKVVFRANGGKFYDGETTWTKYVKKGNTLGSINYDYPSKEGYVCRGFALTATAKEPIDLYDYVPTKATNLYAVYVPEITIKLSANGGKFSDGTTVKDKKIGKGESVYTYSSEVPEKSGYVFYAWYTSKTFTEANKYVSGTAVNKNTTLYARYVKYYTVTAVAVGGGKYGTVSGGGKYNVEKVTFNVPQGMPINAASSSVYTNTLDGYVFDGWYLDSACTASKRISTYNYLGDYVPRGNVTVYAKWLKQIKVVFNGNGGKTINNEKTVTVYTASGKPVGTQPNFTNGTKTFAGWYLDKALTKKVPYAFGYAPTKNTTFYAKWVSSVTITFNANGGTFSNKASTKKYSGKKGSELRQNVEAPTRSGYIFEGWYAEKTYKTHVYDPYHYNVTKAATLYAKWVAAVSITFKAGKGSFFEAGKQVASLKWNYAKGYSANAMLGYYADHELTGAGADAVGYYGNYPYPQSPSGYYFVGWYSDSALTKAYDFSKTLTKSITLYAKYAKETAQTKITLTIDPNGGQISSKYSNKIQVNKNQPVYSMEYSSRVVPPKGKAFAGYTTKKDDPKTLIVDKTFTKNTTIYAYYTVEYTVVLHANGGFNNGGSYYNGYVYDVFNLKTIKVRQGNPVGNVYYDYMDKYADHMLTNSAGLIFRGWYSDKACTKFVTYDLNRYVPTKNIILYAKWGKPTAAAWKKTNGKWWYKIENGDYYKDGFFVISNKMYYFDASGYIVTGWKKINNQWYYFNSSGAELTGWQKISGKWYYLSPYMLKSWQKIGSKWYYLGTDGVMRTGWQKISNKWYYFESSGAMVTGSKTIGSKTYNFNSSGVCLNP